MSYPIYGEQIKADDSVTSDHVVVASGVLVRNKDEENHPRKSETYLAGQSKRIPGEFSLRVQNAPIADVIRTLAEMTGQNVVFADSLSGRVTANLKNVSPEYALRAVLLSHGLVVREDKKTLIIFDRKREKTERTAAKSFRLSYADATEVAKSVEVVVGDSGRIGANGAANTVVVSGTPLELMQAEQIITAMDRPEKQVKVEAEVIAVNRSHIKELGIDWDFKSLTGGANYDSETWDREQRRYTKQDVEVPEGYAGISYGRAVNGHPYTFFFQAQLNALVSQGKAKVLARPNVVTMNGRQAEILIGSQIPVIVEHTENGVKTTATEYRDAGIKLTYTPRISEQNEITADVRAEVSTPYLVPEMKAYRIITRQANTMVRLRSGDRITIGGLIDKEENKIFRKVPILGDIPLLGKLFQSRSTSEEESEVVIIIRADIIE